MIFQVHSTRRNLYILEKPDTITSRPAFSCARANKRKETDRLRIRITMYTGIV